MTLHHAIPPSPCFASIAPLHLLRTGQVHLGDGFVTSPNGGLAFLTGSSLTHQIWRWLLADRDRTATLFGPDELLDEILEESPRIVAQVVPFVAAVYTGPLPQVESQRQPQRLHVANIRQLESLEASWLWEHLEGPVSLLHNQNRAALGPDGRLASLAIANFVAPPYADIAVATAPAFRRSGAAVACCAALVAQLLREGLRPAWNTAESHTASRRLSARLGFTEQARYRAIYLARTSSDR